MVKVNLKSVLPLAALMLASGCAELHEARKDFMALTKKPPSVYPVMPFADALGMTASGAEEAARIVAVFDGTTEWTLDLPAPYDEGWIRLNLSDLDDRKIHTINAAAPRKYQKFVDGLREGDLLELMVVRIPRLDMVDFNVTSRSKVILRVDKMRHADDASLADLERQGITIDFYSVKDSRDFLKLEPDGRFILYGGGNEMSGSYSMAGETVTLKLSDGQVSRAVYKDGILTDSGGVEWILR